MNILAFSLKTSCGLNGASRLYNMCYFTEYHFKENNFEMILEYYPCIVEAAIEYKIYSRKMIADYKSKF